MKSQRRHELQHNLLDAELGKIIGFFKKYGNYIAWGVLIAALIILVATYSVSKQRRAVTDIHARYDRAMTDSGVKPDDRINDLTALAVQDADSKVAALACIAAGDAYGAKLVTSLAPMSADQRKENIRQAEVYYRMAINNFANRPEIVARAHFGLGRLAENQRNFDTAQTEYQAVLSMPLKTSGGTIYAAAKKALEGLDELRTPIPMATTAPAPKVEK